jgi:LPXTG-motif cell wall-anchored protein
MYSLHQPIPAQWPKPDYFSFKQIFTPASWFPDHTIAGKIFNVLDPIGSAVERKALNAEKEQLASAGAAYDTAIADSQAKLATAVEAQKATAAAAAAEGNTQNIMLILGAVVILGIGFIFIIKKKRK